ncbi:MAG TPA: multiheme c-type cytochrome [Kofleriaceae bacterium]|nr:multiheme c-type cytochrome [Kofleriaceae bacterium]
MPDLTTKIAVLSLAAAALACSANKSKSNGDSAAKPAGFSVFVTTELRGNIEPCGCTSDPMGDLARTVAVVQAARAGAEAVLYVDGGSTLFSDTRIPAHLAAQQQLSSDLLFGALTERLQVAAMGLGPNDLARGPAGVRPARQVANLPAAAGVPVEAPKLVQVGGVQVGIFGVVAPAAVSGLGIEPTDPKAAAAKAVAELRGRGARVVLGLAHMTRSEARQLAREVPAIDFLVIGQNAPEPALVDHEPMKVDDTWLVQPANRGQVVTRLDVTVRGAGGLTDAIGEGRATYKISTLSDRIAGLEQELPAMQADPTADQEFIATKQRELAELKEERASLQRQPLVVPPTGSWFTMTQIEIRKGLACDPELQQQKQALDKAIGVANLAAAQGTEPAPVPEGQAGFSGIEECSMCHAEAVTFWKGTSHARAWKTLEDLNKQLDYDCIGCHVTGWDRPGGATLARNEDLRDVQCEVCHAAGSLHVDADGSDQPRTVVLSPPEELCKGCHNPDHSDTFDYQAYLRDVTGPGHGEAFRKKLGDGPTGHALRKAALEKAGASIGQGCLK